MKYQYQYDIYPTEKKTMVEPQLENHGFFGYGKPCGSTMVVPRGSTMVEFHGSTMVEPHGLPYPKKHGFFLVVNYGSTMAHGVVQSCVVQP